MVNYAGYPYCEDGDVLIVLSATVQFQLHSEILKRHCHFFMMELVEPRGEAGEKFKKFKSIRWRFDLQNNNGLQRVELDAHGNPITNNTARTGFQAGQPYNPVFDCYKQVIDAIYGRPLNIVAENMGELMLQITGIVDYAEYLGCCHTVTRTLDSLMLEHGQVLWQAIANDPVSWADFALRIKSLSLTKEIAIHIVGKWSSLNAHQKSNIPLKLRCLCESKWNEVEEQKKEVEMNMINYRLPKLSRDPKGQASDLTRASYANDIMDWLAADVMHQWLAATACQAKNRLAADGGFAFYTVIAAGEDAYLDKKDLKEWHKRCPMSSRGEGNLHTHLKELKTQLKHVIKPLMQQNANLDTNRHPIDWLTCANFSRQDIAGLWVEGVLLDWDDPKPSTTKRLSRFQRSASSSLG